MMFSRHIVRCVYSNAERSQEWSWGLHIGTSADGRVEAEHYPFYMDINVHFNDSTAED